MAENENLISRCRTLIDSLLNVCVSYFLWGLVQEIIRLRYSETMHVIAVVRVIGTSGLHGFTF